MPQTEEIVFDTMRYRRSEPIQRSGDFHSKDVSYVEKITLRDKMSANYEAVKFIN